MIPSAKTTFGATAILVVSLTATSATDLGTNSATGAEPTRVAVPLPKARPAQVRTRVARAPHWRRAIVGRQAPDWPREPYWFWHPHERLAAARPMLIVGIGF